jgi:hypothetical protein
MSDKAVSVPPSQIIKWTIKMPLLTNYYMLRDIVIFFVAVCVFFFVLVMGMAVLTDNTDGMGTYLLLWAAASGALLVLMLIAILGVFMNSTEFTYDIRSDGIMMSVGSKERKINKLALVIGLLTGNIRVLGAGMLSSSREDYFLAWEDVRRVSVHRGPKMLVLKAGLIPGNRIFCTTDNFPAVEKAFREHAKGAKFLEK